MSRPCILWSFFPCASISEVALDSFAVEFWGWEVLYSIVLSSMMLFKRSFGLTRSLFILYVHEHDRLGFGMLTVETAVIAFVDFNSSNCDRKGQYTCQLFFSKMREIFCLHRIWISEDLSKSSEDRRRFPATSEDFPMTSGDNRRSRKIFDDFKTGGAAISRGCPSNLEHYLRVPKMFWRLLDRTSKSYWNFVYSVFKQLHSLMSVRREKLVWMREITILDP